MTSWGPLNQKNADKALPKILALFWTAFIAAKLLYIVGAFIIRKSGFAAPLAGDHRTQMAVLLALAVATIVSTNAHRLIARYMLKPIEERDDEYTAAQIFRYVILKAALYESPAVLGLVYFFLTGRLDVLAVFSGYSFSLYLMSFPTRTKLRDLALRMNSETGLFKTGF